MRVLQVKICLTCMCYRDKCKRTHVQYMSVVLAICRYLFTAPSSFSLYRVKQLIVVAAKREEKGSIITHPLEYKLVHHNIQDGYTDFFLREAKAIEHLFICLDPMRNSVVHRSLLPSLRIINNSSCRLVLRLEFLKRLFDFRNVRGKKNFLFVQFFTL